MRIYQVAIAILSLTTLNTGAQAVKPKAVFGVDLLYSKPVGNLRSEVKFGAGTEVYGGIGWRKTMLLVTTGYRVFADQLCMCNNLLEFVPVKAGFKQYFSNTMFLQADAGIASVKSGGAVQTSFATDLGFGVQLSKFKLGIFYETFRRRKYYEQNTANAGCFTAKIGYIFSSKPVD